MGQAGPPDRAWHASMRRPGTPAHAARRPRAHSVAPRPAPIRRGYLVPLAGGLALVLLAVAVVIGAVLGSPAPGGTAQWALPTVSPPPATTVAAPSMPVSTAPTASTKTTPVAPGTCPASLGYQGRPASSTGVAVANAFVAGITTACVTHLGIALYDRQTRTWYGAGELDRTFFSASLVKVFIASRMLVEKTFDQSTLDRMWRMITCSDDAVASSLWNTVGGRDLIAWVAKRYGVTGLVPPPANQPGYWGFTGVTARAMAAFYAQVMTDPAVWPWLGNAMAHAAQRGCDNFNQYYGIPATAASGWGAKQGWMQYNGATRMHSTGYLEDGRYTVALLMEGTSRLYADPGAAALTAIARALLPGGHIPGSQV